MHVLIICSESKVEEAGEALFSVTDYPGDDAAFVSGIPLSDDGSSPILYRAVYGNYSVEEAQEFLTFVGEEFLYVVSSEESSFQTVLDTIGPKIVEPEE